jgi:hypothetical protein
MDCPFCSREVDPDDPDNYQEATSWVTGPKLDHPVLRERSGRVAHKACIEKLVDGQAPDQETII